ncbi:hypothetical protein BAE44_0016007 [Dichanthelium oligosanthes]|uniref:VQ domain-containing protein n=1 Tax=Dichanthelium oligosanthes TaxID=888268 RepID=A0A1E5VCU3_9POAL|nr:hypothetical protein BAE44_0016007 [Dichanthelium oligosanthes]
MSPTLPRQPGGARHAAFKVRRDSHSIHKTISPLSSSSTNSSVSSSSNAAITSNGHRPVPAPAPRQKQPQQQQPVIIYTHSPKVIRTNPRDFMSIVQKLTGLDSPGPTRGGAPTAARINLGPAAAAAQDEWSSSESCANTHAAGPPPLYADPQLMPPPAPPLDAHFMAPDIPLFTHEASDLQQLSAPRGLYGLFPPVVDAAALGPVMAATNMSSAASNGGAVFSPSMVEAMRTFPDYN